MSKGSDITFVLVTGVLPFSRVISAHLKLAITIEHRIQHAMYCAWPFLWCLPVNFAVD